MQKLRPRHSFATPFNLEWVHIKRKRKRKLFRPDGVQYADK